MIPGPLVLPAAPRRLGPPRRALVVRVAAVALVLAAVSGALAWALLLSPLTLQRWNLFDSTLEFDAPEAGTYVVYEEGPGAADRVGPPLALVSVRSLGGRKVNTTSLIDDQGHSATTYRTPWHEGRGLVSFEVDHAGTFELFAFPSPDASTGSSTNAAGTRGQFFDLAKLPLVAVGPEGRPGALGSEGGLVLLTVVPLLAGVLLLLVARWRWPSPLRRPRRERRGRRGGDRPDDRSAPPSPVPVGAR